MANGTKHPAERVGTLLALMGAAVVAWSLYWLFFRVTSPALVVLGCGVILVALGVYTRVSGPMAMLINQSLNALKLGRVEEARTFLAAAEARGGRWLFPRPLLMQRAELAQREGHVDEALALLERANRVPLGIATREHARMQRDDVRASVALLRAGRGDAEGARAAIATAITDASTATSRARLVVAELVLLSRAGDREALRRTLDVNRTLLFGSTSPRERVLVRGLERMLDQARPDPYREPSQTRERDASVTVAEWVRALAPEVAEFVVDRHLAEGPTETMRFATPSADAMKRVEAPPQTLGARPRASKNANWPTLLLFVTVFWGVFGALNGTVGEGWPPVLSTLLLWGPSFVAFLGIVAWSFRRARVALRPLRASALAIATGDHARAREILAPLLRSSLPLSHATAALNMGVLEGREGDFAKALESCNDALGQCTGRMRRVAAYDLFLPLIHAERAFLLAALGREEDSTAEVSRFEREFPTFGLRGAAEFRVKITQLVRRGEYAEAAQLGRERSVHMQLGLHEELLLDVLDVVDRGEDEARRARLAREIEQHVHLRHWFEALAPSLVARLYARSTGARERSAETWDEEEEGEEARARRVLHA